MTTQDWLRHQRVRILRREGFAMGLALAGALALALALGVIGARVGAYRRVPELVFVGWVAVAAVVAAAVTGAARRLRRLTAARLGAELERRGGLRAGAVAGLAVPPLGSGALAALADRRMAEWLAEHERPLLAGARAARRRLLQGGIALAAVGAVTFAASGPSRGGDFWQPVEVVRRARGPVVLELSRSSVPRGDSIVAQVTARGRVTATVYVRAAGEEWRGTRVVLDSAGSAGITLGPLDSDRYVYATSGARSSDTLTVTVTAVPFLVDLALLAQYPAYLERADEPLPVGADTLLLPENTRVVARGRASTPVSTVAWTDGTRRVPLRPDGGSFEGSLMLRASATWTLEVSSADGVPLEDAAPQLRVRVVPDSAPVVSVPIPGADTTAPTSLRQPLVIDVRDDHRVTRVEVVSRRVSRLGVRGPAVTESVPLPEGGVERAVLQWLLDLNERGFLPGDTAFFRVRVRDNAPASQLVETREFALRLPSLAELREAARAEARGLAASADSVARGQRDLGRKTQDLARERERSQSAQSGREGAEQLGFRAAERAGEITGEQRQLLERAEALRDRIEELARQAWDAGLTDPAWHQQLAELRELLERAITPELEQVLRELEEAMRRLDAPGVREALERLAQAQDQLRRELERSRPLFERAALEGEMTTLAQDAAELAARQREWTRAVERTADTALAEKERALGARADSLARALQRVEEAAAQAGAPADASGADRARAAAAHMRRAARAAAAGSQRGAVQAGGAAADELDPIAGALEQQRDALRDQWRAEVLAALDRALVETAQLARRQEELERRLHAGESGPDVRAGQAATRDGVDRVLDRLQGAAGRNALVSPSLGAVLGYARNRMNAALDALQQGNPNSRAATEAAGEALDGLNALAGQLVRSRAAVAGAESGSGFREAVERMAQLAQQQGNMAGQGASLLPLMSMGGSLLMQELQALARQQRQLAAELERLRAQGDMAGVGELAQEAETIARQLEQGVLDRQTVERQERLYRRLLDRGRTLRGSEEDERKDRLSETARPDNRFIPSAPPPRGAGPRFPYPTWDQLQHLSPADRRLILDYFRRLNEGRTP